MAAEINLRERILADRYGRDAPKCFNCGMCVGGCPVAYVENYNPVTNLYDACYNNWINPNVWWCATCYTCQDRCPHDVHMVEIIFLLQRLYVEIHGIPDFIRPLVHLVEETGYMAKITASLNQRRARLGLPSLSLDIGHEVGKMLLACNGDLAGASRSSQETPGETSR
ncbi:MAG: 4Fe-4S dicluster domain-containing protein [Anaerolineae bacterium]